MTHITAPVCHSDGFLIEFRFKPTPYKVCNCFFLAESELSC